MAKKKTGFKPKKITKKRAASNVKKALSSVGKAAKTKKRGRPKSDIVKPAAYKGAVRSVKAYEKNLASGKENQSAVVEKFAQDIKKYLNKDGTLRKNISQKRLKEFNELVNQFKATPQSTAAFRIKAAKDKRHEAVYRMTQNKKAGALADHLFEDNIVKKLLKTGALDYEAIFEIADGYSDMNAQEIIDNIIAPVAHNLAKQEGYEEVATALMEYDSYTIPESSRVYHSQDDLYKDLQRKLEEAKAAKKARRKRKK